ncbi:MULTISPECIES: TolC family protein [Flavobacteriaceae]|jgi:outer membrane protein TolC|uniref:Outer membrane protein TolC n=3 Tax=Flavobacteriaceae TaxID=49546 RepID=A0A1K1NCF7_9FLAO|nr:MULTISPECIES: TolC family protein [Flavobacteriaceae]MCL6219035.1 TolC family protein [Zunongwangia pacifica]SFW32953.1 Outer membrane protein TolC [Sinomicrobium oceani]
MRYIILIALVFFAFAEVNAQDLASYIQEAEKNNPEIQAFELRYNIAEEKVNEVNSLPNTEFNFGVMAIAPEMDMPMEQFSASVMQMLPWFGTISARENYASSIAEAQYVDIAIAKRKLSLSVSQSYYKLYAIRAKQLILDENIELLQTYERLALTSLEVGKASAVDVLRLQIRQNELVQQKEVLEQGFQAEQTLFNNLLNREENMSVDVVEEMMIPDVDPLVLNENLQINPELIKYDKLYESVEQSELLNQKESGPMVGFGVQYINQENSPMITSSFKDMVMPMLSISIPIFNNKYKSVTRQNELKQLEIKFQKEDRLNKLETLLAQGLYNRNATRIKFNVQTDNLKQAIDAEEILMKNYETGTIDFNDVLDVQELQLKFQINLIDSIKEYFTEYALINYLTR